MDSDRCEAQENSMRLLVPSLLVAATAGCSVQAQPRAPASSSDLAYCTELSRLYARYVGGDEFTSEKKQVNRDVEARWAMSRCQAGDPAPAIPILEHKITAAKMTLPPRP